jgi:replicative DNA helicase
MTRDDIADLTTLRIPPWSEAAEQSVLGSLLTDNAAWERVRNVLTGASFYAQRHRVIFEAIGRLVESGKPADVVTVYTALTERQASDVGGLEYINALAMSVASASNAGRYAAIVAESALRRSIIAACDAGATLAWQKEGTAAEALDKIAAKFSSLERKTMHAAPKLLADLLAGAIDRVSALANGTSVPGWSTNIPRLNRMLSGGLRPGKVYVLAARPSVGKSSFAQALGLHFAEIHGPALMLSQEMPESEVAERAISALGQVDYGAVQTGKLTDDEWTRFVDAVEAGRSLPFYVDDQAALKIGDIRAKARQVKGLKLLIVDYLQLCASDESSPNRNAEIEQISRGLKALSKELGIAVLCLSQLNREVEKRASKEPMLSDLRDSGAIEQDADVVIFLWPAKEYETGSKLVGCKLDKNRQGVKGRFLLDFHGGHQRWGESTVDFESLAPAGKTSRFE